MTFNENLKTGLLSLIVFHQLIHAVTLTHSSVEMTLTTISNSVVESQDFLSRPLISSQQRNMTKLRVRRVASCDPDVVVPLVAYVGQKVELQCHRCTTSAPRSVKENMRNLNWMTQSRTAASEEKIGIKKAVLGGFSIKYEDMKLVIKSIDEEHSGKYYCKNRERYLSNYDITVLPKPDFHLVIPSEGQQPYEDDRDGQNVVMHTKWGEWSSCNHCNTPGERVRIGYCYAMVLPRDFPDGVPCRSSVVPYSKRKIYADRKDEKMVEACKVPCPTENPDSVKIGKNGRKTIFLEFSMANKPTLPPFLSRRAIYADMGSDVALACPTFDFEKAIRWQNGSTPLHLLELRKTSDDEVQADDSRSGYSVQEPKRVLIDALDVLHIRNLTMWDTAIYSCWQDDKNIVTIKVKVVEALVVDEKVKGQLLYSGFVFTGLIMFMICFGVFRNRKFVK